MLRALLGRDTDNPMVLVGLSDENIARLKADYPIKAAFSTFGVDYPGHLVIIHGSTEADLERKVRSHGIVDEQTRQRVDPRIDQIAEARSRHKHILIATVGLPRSGKTTWARQQAYPIVNPDSIRLALHGNRFIDRAEPFVWAIAKTMVRSLFLAGHSTVILDATNTTAKRRDEWKSKDWALFFKHIQTPPEICIARAKAEKDDEILPVIDRMAGQWEPLTADDPLWP